MRRLGVLSLAALALVGGTLFGTGVMRAAAGTSRPARPGTELLRSRSGGTSSEVDYAPLFDPAARSACLARVTTSSNAPLLVAIGASFTAGVGASSPQDSWAVDLAQMLGWRAVVAGASGVGYVHRGGVAAGPLSRLLAIVDLPKLRPRLVIIQGGHDDMHEPAAREASAVASLWRQLARELPDSTVGAITVFVRGAAPSAPATAIDRTIVRAIVSADPRAVVMDPLTAHWNFARSPDRLHPSTLGDLEIARLAAARLSAAGIASAGARPAPVCVLTKPYPIDATSVASD